MNYTAYIIDQIESLNPVHAKKLKKHSDWIDDEYFREANSFYQKYVQILDHQNRTIDFAIDCYLGMIADMTIERVEFYRSGKYSSTTFAEVNDRVYSSPNVIEYYMHGLVLSQFLWKHHYELFTHFSKSLPTFIENKKNYLEIGAGHGLYLSKALKVLNPECKFSVVDVSQTSIELAQKFNCDERVRYHHMNVFNFNAETKFDFIVMGEVLEHVEQPLNLLLKVNDLLTDNGTLFITTPTNAPAIDHIYLFNSVKEIQNIIKLAGFNIESQMSFLSEDVSKEKAEKLKVSISYGAFLKKQLS
ncbi:MAG: class I SAM-dependent methyltransferase [Prolixibacteraceae bacterium]|jgi:2-polyprenyl-3-methyl-5-hydroxy-6-metoxy-1,4-benzoquinol methylase|nr:class I SAM-dependent methyltransferase [Prolixibacteraceae bacterium]